MATPMPHEERVRELPTNEPVSGPRQTRAPRALTPDEEAMQLMVKVMERARVATSFAKLAGGLLAATGAQASMVLRAVADAKVAEMRKMARAAKDAAVHVATHRPDPDAPAPAPESEELPETLPETQDAPPAQDAQHAAE